MATLNLRVGADWDHVRVTDDDPPDATWDAILVDPTQFHLVGRFTDAYGEGLRFLGVTIAQAGTINSAILTWTCRAAASGTDVLTNIDGEDADNAATFVSGNLANYTDRPRTDALVPWDNLGAWVLNTEYESPELKTILQEIVDRGTWSSGNAVVFFWENDGSSASAYRAGYSHEGDSAKAPELDIDYTAAGASNLKVVGSVAVASIGKISTIAMASVKKVSGVSNV